MYLFEQATSHSESSAIGTALTNEEQEREQSELENLGEDTEEFISGSLPKDSVISLCLESI